MARTTSSVKAAACPETPIRVVGLAFFTTYDLEDGELSSLKLYLFGRAAHCVNDLVVRLGVIQL